MAAVDLLDENKCFEKDWRLLPDLVFQILKVKSTVFNDNEIFRG